MNRLFWGSATVGAMAVATTLYARHNERKRETVGWYENLYDFAELRLEGEGGFGVTMGSILKEVYADNPQGFKYGMERACRERYDRALDVYNKLGQDPQHNMKTVLQWAFEDFPEGLAWGIEKSREEEHIKV